VTPADTRLLVVAYFVLGSACAGAYFVRSRRDRRAFYLLVVLVVSWPLLGPFAFAVESLPSGPIARRVRAALAEVQRLRVAGFGPEEAASILDWVVREEARLGSLEARLKSRSHQLLGPWAKTEERPEQRLAPANAVRPSHAGAETPTSSSTAPSPFVVERRIASPDSGGETGAPAMGELAELAELESICRRERAVLLEVAALCERLHTRALIAGLDAAETSELCHALNDRMRAIVELDLMLSPSTQSERAEKSAAR